VRTRSATRRPQTRFSQHTTAERRKIRTHAQCAHAITATARLRTPKSDRSPKPDPCRFYPTDVHQTDAASFKRDALHMCIGHGTTGKRRIRRCIPCMCICICMWMWMCMWICMWMCMCAQHTHAVRARITCVVTSAPPELGGIPPHNSPFTNGTPLASPRWMHAAPRRTQVSYTRPTNPHNHTPTTRTQPHATWPQHNHTPTPTVMAQLIHPTAQVPISAAGAHQRSGCPSAQRVVAFEPDPPYCRAA